MSIESALQGPGRAILVAFGLLIAPQVAGLIANRAFARWMPWSRLLGAVIPTVLVFWVQWALADYDAVARRSAGITNRGNHTGVMIGLYFLPPLHFVVALTVQSLLRYGPRHRVQ